MCVCLRVKEGRKCRWNTVCVCVCVCLRVKEGRKCRWNTVCVCVFESEGRKEV